MTGPIPDSYWLLDGNLLAGEYPATADEDASRVKLSRFLEAGIRTFIDLTEADEPLAKYDALLREIASERGLEVRYFRFPIRDVGLPADRSLVRQIFVTIRDEMAAGRPVYVHCWGGVGRTGTIIGCWLVEYGADGASAIARIAELRQRTPDGFKPSPETHEQRRYVCDWIRELKDDVPERVE